MKKKHGKFRDKRDKPGPAIHHLLSATAPHKGWHVPSGREMGEGGPAVPPGLPAVFLPRGCYLQDLTLGASWTTPPLPPHFHTFIAGNMIKSSAETINESKYCVVTFIQNNSFLALRVELTID